MNNEIIFRGENIDFFEISDKYDNNFSASQLFR